LLCFEDSLCKQAIPPTITGAIIVGVIAIFRQLLRMYDSEVQAVIREIAMNVNAKVEKYEANRLGLLPVAGLTIRQTLTRNGRTSQALTVELLKGEQTVSLTFTGLRQLRLEDLHPGSLCLLNISSVTQDQMESVRYRVFNTEQ
jgi:hypothetical protein